MKNSIWLVFVSLLYSQISIAGTCRNFEDVSAVLSEAYNFSKENENENGILNSLIPHDELKKLKSLNILVDSGALVYFSDAQPSLASKMDTISTKSLSPEEVQVHEQMFASAALIEVPIIAVLESGKIISADISFENKQDHDSLCRIGVYARSKAVTLEK